MTDSYNTSRDQFYGSFGRRWRNRAGPREWLAGNDVWH